MQNSFKIFPKLPGSAECNDGETCFLHQYLSRNLVQESFLLQCHFTFMFCWWLRKPKMHYEQAFKLTSGCRKYFGGKMLMKTTATRRRHVPRTWLHTPARALKILLWQKLWLCLMALPDTFVAALIYKSYATCKFMSSERKDLWKLKWKLDSSTQISMAAKVFWKDLKNEFKARVVVSCGCLKLQGFGCPQQNKEAMGPPKGENAQGRASSK